MKVISSQHYINAEIVEEKIRALSAAETSEITLTCWDAGEIDGEELVVLADGHHAYEAAKELGITVQFEITRHPEHLIGETLLEVAWMDGDWYYIETSEPTEDKFDLVW